MNRKRKPKFDDLFRGVEDSIAAFVTALSSTVAELDEITQRSDPVTEFLESLEFHVDEIQTVQALSSPQRDFLRTLFSTLRSGVLSQQ
ncbi:MAG: hypothetical protein OXH06_01340 [Gemmatimonadetes bacterium]|nr:hypothetical protein [Gemmatimonadota bacterium]